MSTTDAKGSIKYTHRFLLHRASQARCVFFVDGVMKTLVSGLRRPIICFLTVMARQHWHFRSPTAAPAEILSLPALTTAAAYTKPAEARHVFLPRDGSAVPEKSSCLRRPHNAAHVERSCNGRSTSCSSIINVHFAGASSPSLFVGPQTFALYPLTTPRHAERGGDLASRGARNTTPACWQGGIIDAHVARRAWRKASRSSARHVGDRATLLG